MKFTNCVIVLLAILSSVQAESAAPGRITLQGVLRTENGEPQSGAFDFRVQIFPDASSTNAFLDETIEKQPVATGIFSLEIGNTTSDLADKLAAASEPHVQIAVNGTSLPRQRLSSAMYSLHAQTAVRSQTAARAESIPFSGIINRPAPTCPNGTFLKSISSDGVPQCATAVVQVNAGDGLTGSPVTSNGTIAVDFGKVATANHVHTCRIQLGSGNGNFSIPCAAGERAVAGFCNNGGQGQANENFSHWICSTITIPRVGCDEYGTCQPLPPLTGGSPTEGRALCCGLTIR